MALSMDEICAHIGISKNVVKNLIKHYRFPAKKPDAKNWEFQVSEVDAWMKRPAIPVELYLQGGCEKLLFGRYIQKQNGTPEPIEWQVLEKKKDRVLIISKYVLEFMQFQSGCQETPPTTWETCSLRKWLNGEFLETAFTEAEKAIIPRGLVLAEENPYYDFLPQDPGNDTKDHIFLLSIGEAEKYFKPYYTVRCKPTAYCIAREEAEKGFSSGSDFLWWWLRTVDTRRASVAYDYDIVETGVGYSGKDTTAFGGVRPALWISLGG